MAGPVKTKTKTVCFIATAVIAWGLFEVGDAAWFNYKVNATEILRNFEISPNRYSLCVSFLAFTSVATKNIKLGMISWMLDYWLGWTWSERFKTVF
jgi:hypothetical protein